MTQSEADPRPAEVELAVVGGLLIDDPATFTAPFTAAIPMTRSPEPIFEYACDEGNYGMANVLRAGRAEDTAAVRAR